MKPNRPDARTVVRTHLPEGDAVLRDAVAHGQHAVVEVGATGACCCVVERRGRLWMVRIQRIRNPPTPRKLYMLKTPTKSVRTGEDALGVELELALVRLDRYRDGADVEGLEHGLLRPREHVHPVHHLGAGHGLAGALLAEAVLGGVGVVLLGAEPAVLLDPLCGVGCVDWIGFAMGWVSGGAVGRSFTHANSKKHAYAYASVDAPKA